MSTCVVVRTPSSGARTTCAPAIARPSTPTTRPAITVRSRGASRRGGAMRRAAAGGRRGVARRFTPWRRHASRRDGEIDGPFLVAGRERARFTGARAGIVDTVTEAAGTGRHHAGAVWQHHHIPRRREHADEHAPFAEAADAVLTTFVGKADARRRRRTLSRSRTLDHDRRAGNRFAGRIEHDPGNRGAAAQFDNDVVHQLTGGENDCPASSTRPARTGSRRGEAGLARGDAKLAGRQISDREAAVVIGEHRGKVAIAGDDDAGVAKRIVRRRGEYTAAYHARSRTRRRRRSEVARQRLCKGAGWSP